ncbi:MAG: hypothetical protein IJ716_08385 [Lachnospiraceae bacterium]|nr:hypothetical protein [Lachnospiraceae bacterium]MBR1743905.1 hypothetical protein [Lachnospiraceae bacterium]
MQTEKEIRENLINAGGRPKVGACGRKEERVCFKDGAEVGVNQYGDSD